MKSYHRYIIYKYIYALNLLVSWGEWFWLGDENVGRTYKIEGVVFKNE